MINNARAESDARSARGVDGPMHGEVTSDYEDEREKRRSESDGDESGYEDEYPYVRFRHVQGMTKRESI